jgi:hypothetical protein
VPGGNETDGGERTPYAEHDDLREDSGTATGDDSDGNGDGASRLAYRIVGGLLGVDIVARLGPALVDTVLPYLFGATRLLDPGVGESVIILFGLVVRSPDMVWGLSWLVLVAVAVLYVPELVRPDRPYWPAPTAERVLFAVPVIWSALLVEAVFRGVLAATVAPTTAPFVAPLTPLTVGGAAGMTLVLFGLVYRDSDPDSSPREHSLPGYLTRALVLVVLLGVFLAAFSMLSPYAELLAVALYLLSQRDAASDPAERLIESAATVWERPAQTVMAVYVTAALAVVVFTLLAVRTRAPTNLFARAPVSTVYLLLVALGLLVYTLAYCERALRPFRRNYDPDSEPTALVEGGLIPAAILVSLLLDGYVFGDPLAGPGLVTAVVGSTVALGAITTPIDDGSLDLFGEDEGQAAESGRQAGGIEVTKTAERAPEADVIEITFGFETTYDDSTTLELEETYPIWGDDELVLDVSGPGEWTVSKDQLTYTTTVPGRETETASYQLVAPPSTSPDQTLNGFQVDIEESDRGVRSLVSSPDPAYQFQPYHLPIVSVGLFAALLGAVAPLEGQYLATAMLDGPPFGLDALATARQFATVFLLVVLPYVPVAVLTHRRYVTELRSSIGLEPESDTVTRLKRVAMVSVLGVGALCIAIVDVPAIPSSVERLLPWGLSVLVVFVSLVTPGGLLWNSLLFVTEFAVIRLLYTVFYTFVGVFAPFLFVQGFLGIE